MACTLIAVSGLLVVLAAIDEQDGNVTVHSRRGAPRTYTAAEHPSEFRNAMTFHWICAPLPGAAGLFLLWLIRRQDRLDPSSPHFQGSPELDELGQTLDHELDRKRKD